jgi:AcrR family transcriptional regulator
VTNAAEMFADVARVRAKRLSSDDRRSSIIDAVIPLLVEHGRAVTTRQIADAAGVAEGTLFRAFGDKESLIEAAFQRFVDPEPLHRQLAAIDAELTLEQKVNDILFIMRSRMRGVHGMMHAMGMTGPPPRRADPEELTRIIAGVLEPDTDRLGASTEQVISFIRMVAFATSIPAFTQGQDIPTEQLAALITHGIAGPPAEGRSPRAS